MAGAPLPALFGAVLAVAAADSADLLPSDAAASPFAFS